MIDNTAIDEALKYAWAKHYAEGLVVSEAFMRKVIRTAVEFALFAQPRRDTGSIDGGAMG